MIVVAIVALLLGAIIEWSNYRNWAQEDGLEQIHLDNASNRDQEAAECRVNAANKEPYVALKSLEALVKWGPMRIGEKPPASWAEEAAFHADQAMIERMYAAERSRKKVAFEGGWLCRVAINWSNYRRWEEEGDRERFSLDCAKDDDRIAAECRAQVVKGAPFVPDPPDPIPPPSPWYNSPTSWAENAAFHDDQASAWRIDAETHRRNKTACPRPWFRVAPVIAIIKILILVFAISFAWNRVVRAIVRRLRGTSNNARTRPNPPLASH